jgi:hypothetical protein
LKSSKRHLAVLVTLLLALGACKGHSAASSFSAKNDEGLWFLTLNRTDSSVSGTITASAVDLDNPPYIATLISEFTGLLNGSKITLTLSQSGAWSKTWTGTLAGSELTLTFSNGDAGPATLLFEPASLDEYRSSVRLLSLAASDSLATSGEEDDKLTAQQKIDKDRLLVLKDLDQLAKDVAAAQAGLAPMDGLLASIRAHMSAAHKAQIAGAGRKKEVACSYSSEATAEANAASAVAGTVGAKTQEILASITKIRLDSTKLATDFAQLKSDREAAPFYKSKTMPTQTQINKAIANAGTVEIDAEDGAKQFEDSANSKASTAQGYASDARDDCASAT